MVQIRCLSCGFGRSWKLRRNKRKCKRCRREWSERICPVAGFRIDADDWATAIRVFLRERTGQRLAGEIGVSLKTAQAVAARFRQVMASDPTMAMFGTVEIDETYIGGQRKNKRLHIRRIRSKPGHGTDKLPIVGLFCRDTGQVLACVEPRKLDMGFIARLVQAKVAPGSRICTDAFKMYRGLAALGYSHEYVDHDGGEMVRGDIHTNHIEGFWGILKRRLSCIGGMRRDRIHLFVAEIVWKFNHRHLPFEDQERALLELVLHG